MCSSVAIIDSPVLDCPLAINVDIFPDYLMKLCYTNITGTLSTATPQKRILKKNNKTTIIIILITLPLLLRINNNDKCLRLNIERKNTFTLKLKLILPVPV